jgi:hypothetical protein
MLYADIQKCDAAKLLKFAEFLSELDESARRPNIESGTLVLKRLAQTVNHLSESRRRAVECAIVDLVSS